MGQVTSSRLRAALSTPMGGIVLHEDCGTTAVARSAAEVAKLKRSARSGAPSVR
jgi:hypothetical protein